MRILPWIIFFFSSFGWSKVGPKLISFRLAIIEDFLLPEPGPKGLPSVYEVYMSSLNYALGENSRRLKSCGYEIESLRSFYSSRDKIGILEAARRTEAQKPWLVYGPRRSDDFLLVKRGLETSPMISPMANAASVMMLDPPYFTMYPRYEDFAQAALKAVKKAKWGHTYGSIVERNCTACKDFEIAFTAIAAPQFKRQFWIEVDEASPQIEQLSAQLELQKNIDFLVIPNFAKLSGILISGLQSKFPKIKFLGADAWGDGQYTALGNASIAPHVEGIAFRGGASPNVMAQKFDLPSLAFISPLNGSRSGPHYSGAALILLLRKLTDDLCRLKPKNREEFIAHISSFRAEHFRSPLGIGVYYLKNGTLAFDHFADPVTK